MTLGFSVAQAVTSTAAPPIPKARKWAQEYSSSQDLIESVGPLLDLSQGVPRSAPHETFTDNLSKLASDPESSRYGAILGELSLREAVATEINNLYRLSSQSVTKDNIAITTGCNMAFLTLIMALCPPNESSILIPLPVYFNHMMTLNLQSVKSVYIPSNPSDGFLPDIDSARKHLEATADTKGDSQGKGGTRVKPRMIVLVTPANPTGTVYPHETIKAWYDLAKEFGVALVLDETYREFVDGESEDGEGSMGVPHRLFENPEWRDTLVCVGSFSKGYRIPGHRLGNIIASPELLQHIETICDCMQICPPRLAQRALAPLLPSLRPDLLASSLALSSRRKLFQEVVEDVPGWRVDSKGGYYAYVRFPQSYFSATIDGVKVSNSEDVARILARTCGVIVLPGGFFMPDLGSSEWEDIIGGEALREDQWLRFAVANVEDDHVRALGPRLKRLNEVMGVSEK